MYLPVAWIVTVVALDKQPAVDSDARDERNGIALYAFGQYHRPEPVLERVQAPLFRLGSGALAPIPPSTMSPRRLESEQAGGSFEAEASKLVLLPLSFAVLLLLCAMMPNFTGNNSRDFNYRIPLSGQQRQSASTASEPT